MILKSSGCKILAIERIVCRLRRADVRLAVTEAVAALTGLSTEKITVVQWEQ